MPQPPCPPFPDLPPLDMEAILAEQHAFSLRTFGPGARAAGVVAHIRKELEEVERAPADLSEWVDVMILAADGAMRAGHSPAEVLLGYRAKLQRNFARKWPDWRTAPADAPIEHDRSADPPIEPAELAALLVPSGEPCGRCGGAGWLWLHELDDSTWDGSADDNRYTCRTCDGSGRLLPSAEDAADEEDS